MHDRLLSGRAVISRLSLRVDILRAIRVAALGAMVALGLPGAPAGAVVGGIVDSNSAQSPFAGVGSLTRDGEEVYSAVLIAPQYVLTAAHVVRGTLFPGRLSFNLNVGDEARMFSVPVQEIHIHPEYRGFRPGPDGTVHNDIAVLRLAQPVPAGTPVYRLHEGPVDVGQRILFVGYGAGGEMTSAERVPPQPTLKRRGESAIEWILPGDAGQEVYVFRSQPMVDPAGKGAGLAYGDSGSPSFTQGADGALDLVGINTFTINLSPSQAGSFIAGGGGIVIGPHAQWINAILSAPPASPVRRMLPFGVVALLVAGIVAGAGAWQWRRLRRRPCQSCAGRG